MIRVATPDSQVLRGRRNLEGLADQIRRYAAGGPIPAAIGVDRMVGLGLLKT